MVLGPAPVGEATSIYSKKFPYWACEDFSSGKRWFLQLAKYP